MPLRESGLTELRLSVPEAGKRLLPLPIAVWHKDVGKRVLKPIAKGDDVLVYGQLVRCVTEVSAMRGASFSAERPI
jgi:hypothetical protein